MKFNIRVRHFVHTLAAVSFVLVVIIAFNERNLETNTLEYYYKSLEFSIWTAASFLIYHFDGE